MKLDGKFYGEVRKVKNQLRVPDDEFVVFLAQDNAFAAILPFYLDQCIAMGADAVQIESVGRLIDRVNAWRDQHPDRCKIPDVLPGEALDA